MSFEDRPKKVFLGGTYESQWREQLIALMQPDCPAYYNPVVPDWTPAHQVAEAHQRAVCDYCLFVITPLMTGVYSIAEAVDDSNKRPGATLFCVLQKDGGKSFTPSQAKSLEAVATLVKVNGGQTFTTLKTVADVLQGKVAKT